MLVLVMNKLSRLFLFSIFLSLFLMQIICGVRVFNYTDINFAEFLVQTGFRGVVFLSHVPFVQKLGKTPHRIKKVRFAIRSIDIIQVFLV
eukprot:12101_5